MKKKKSKIRTMIQWSLFWFSFIITFFLFCYIFLSMIIYNNNQWTLSSYGVVIDGQGMFFFYIIIESFLLLLLLNNWMKKMNNRERDRKLINNRNTFQSSFFFFTTINWFCDYLVHAFVFLCLCVFISFIGISFFSIWNKRLCCSLLFSICLLFESPN